MELISVIGILGLLAALTIPVGQKARGQAHQSACVSNLRQLVAANYMYAADHGGYFSPASTVNNLTRWHGRRTAASRPYDPRCGYLSPYFNGGEGPTGAPRSLSFDKDDPYAGTGRELECRAFESYQKSSSSFEKGAGCYGYNAAYIGGSMGDMFNPTSSSLLNDPAHTVMFADTAFASGSSVQEYPFAEPFYSVNADGSLGMGLTPSVHFRHDGKANVAWADGHVTSEEPSRLQNKKHNIGWIGKSEDNGVWNAWR